MFCSKCGNAVADDAGFCGKCGTKIVPMSQKRKEHTLQNEAGQCGKIVALLKSASLFFGGLIMSLLTFPMYIRFEIADRPAIGVLEEWAVISSEARYELKVWNKAEALHEILGVFSWVAVVVLVLGIALWIVEGKGIVRRSKLRSICCILLPVLVGVVVALCTYPAIMDCMLTFDM